MSRGRLLGCAVLTVGAIGLVSADSSLARHPRPCRPAGSRSVAVSDKARVYRLHGRTYACLFSRNRAYQLDVVSANDDRDRGVRVERVLLADKVVAYVLNGESSGGFARRSVQSRNLRNGHLRSAEALAGQTGCDAAEGEADNFVDRLYLKTNGSIAWSAHGTIDVRACATEIDKLDTHGFSQLDQGQQPTLDPASLRLNGSTLSWQDAGMTRTAQLD